MWVGRVGLPVYILDPDTDLLEEGEYSALLPDTRGNLSTYITMSYESIQITNIY